MLIVKSYVQYTRLPDDKNEHGDKHFLYIFAIELCLFYEVLGMTDTLTFGVGRCLIFIAAYTTDKLNIWLYFICMSLIQSTFIMIKPFTLLHLSANKPILCTCGFVLMGFKTWMFGNNVYVGL